MHLYTLHKITELIYHPEREFFLQKFIIYEENAEAQYPTCKTVIVYDMYFLKIHLETYHGKKQVYFKMQ